MRDFLELPSKLSLFSLGCDVGSGKYSPDINSHEAHSVVNTCDNPHRVNIVTCKDPYKHLFLQEVNGLSFDIQLSSSIENLPHYIPILDRNVISIPNLSNIFPIVGLSLNDILSTGIIHKAGGFHESPDITFRENLLNSHCFKNKKTILFNTGPDTLIESVWHKRNSHNVFEKVSKMGFYAIGGFNFSLINGECPFGQTLNLKRSLFSSYLVEQYGNLVIPHIYALTKFHIAKWTTWLTANPNIKYVTINCQLSNSINDITQLSQATTALLDNIPYLHVILQGYQFSYISKFFLGYMNRLHFADKHPLKQAQSHTKLTFSNSEVKLIRHYSKAESISELVNYNFYQRILYLNYLKNTLSQPALITRHVKNSVLINSQLP